jgi:hypothetical protein
MSSFENTPNKPKQTPFALAVALTLFLGMQTQSNFATAKEIECAAVKKVTICTGSKAFFGYEGFTYKGTMREVYEVEGKTIIEFLIEGNYYGIEADKIKWIKKLGSS